VEGEAFIVAPNTHLG